jgi:exocyst complex component 2
MHRALLLLVEAHARLGVVAPSLTSRVLEALVTGLTEVALQCFQQVPKFGTGGMLTVSRKALCNNQYQSPPITVQSINAEHTLNRFI